jgi:hypothetical protein
MEKYLIFISGAAYLEIKKALQQWINLYSRDLKSNFEFKLTENSKGNYIVIPDQRIRNDQFAYLINYLTYPEGINYNVKVSGYFTLTDTSLFPKKLLDKDLCLYIPESDSEHDNVFMVTRDNTAYKQSFTGKTTEEKLSIKYEEPKLDLSELKDFEILKIQKLKDRQEVVSERDIKKRSNRFKVVVMIVLGLQLACYLIKSDTDKFLTMNLIVSFLLIFWLVIDYKLIREKTYYIGFFCLAVFILLYGFYLLNQYSYLSTFRLNTLKSGMIMPLTFLIIQKIFRTLFIKIYKREPVVDTMPAPSFEDGLYSIILLVGSLMLPLYIFR